MLEELGRAPAEIAALEAAGVVRAAVPEGGPGGVQGPGSTPPQKGGREVAPELRLGNR